MNPVGDIDPVAFAWQIADGFLTECLFISLTLAGVVAGLLLVGHIRFGHQKQE